LQETYLTEIDDDVRSTMYGEPVLAIEIADGFWEELAT
jgi:hypothetical protein